MTSVSSILGFVDFQSHLPLQEVAKRLSEELFAGIQFSCEGDGSWDEIPCVHLERNFLGLRVELGGDPNTGYTLELGTALNAISASDGGSTASHEVCDMSIMLKYQLAQIAGLSITEPKY